MPNRACRARSWSHQVALRRTGSWSRAAPFLKIRSDSTAKVDSCALCAHTQVWPVWTHIGRTSANLGRICAQHNLISFQCLPNQPNLGTPCLLVRAKVQNAQESPVEGMRECFSVIFCLRRVREHIQRFKQNPRVLADDPVFRFDATAQRDTILVERYPEAFLALWEFDPRAGSLGGGEDGLEVGERVRLLRRAVATQQIHRFIMQATSTLC